MKALAVCEVCGFLWSVILIGGATYLVGWQGWNGWTYLGAVALLGCWTCRYCPGHAFYGQTRKRCK
jgi:hypothetical protein